MTLFGTKTLAQSDSLKLYINQIESVQSDSARVDLLYDIAWRIWQEQPENAVKLLDYLQDFESKSNFQYRQDVNWYYRSLILKFQNKYVEAENYQQKYLKYHSERKDSSRIAFAYQALSNLYFENGQLTKSLNHALKILAIKGDKVTDEDRYNVTRRITNVMGELGKHEEALLKVREAIALAEKLEDNFMLADIFNDAGLVHQRLKNIDSSIYYYSKYLHLAKENEEPHQVLYAHYNLGTVYEEKGDYHKALNQLLAADKLSIKLNDQAMSDFAYISLASVYNKLGNPNQGKQLLNKININQCTPEGLKDFYFVLHQVEKKQGNYKAALDAFEAFKNVSDSLLNKEISHQASELNVQYETELKEGQITLLNQENNIKDLKLKAAQRTKLLTMFGILGLLLILGLVFNNLRNLRRHKRELSQKNEIISQSLSEKETLLKEIHHRVKNNLQVISSLLNIQSRNMQDEAAQKAIREGRNRVKSIALIHQNLYQDDNLKAINSQEYISALCLSLFNSYNVNGEEVKLTLDIDPIELDVDLIMPIGLILNELISNALKYAFKPNEAGELNVAMHDQPHEFVLDIKDNGAGLPTELNPESGGNMGFELIRAFVTKLKGKLLTPLVDQGSHFQLIIPKS